MSYEQLSCGCEISFHDMNNSGDWYIAAPNRAHLAINYDWYTNDHYCVTCIYDYDDKFTLITNDYDEAEAHFIKLMNMGGKLLPKVAANG